MDILKGVPQADKIIIAILIIMLAIEAYQLYFITLRKGDLS